MSGWIKLHRSIKEHFIYDFSEPDKALAWIDILLSASYADSKVKIKTTLFDVKKGQWLVSQVTLQTRWKMSQNKVKRLLNLLKNDGMIDVETNALTSIITICNYNNYQDDERTDEQPNERAGEREADDQSNDIKRSKQIKKVNNTNKLPYLGLDLSSWPALPDPEIFAAWCQVKKKNKGSISQSAMNTIGKEMHLAAKQGISVNECLAVAENSGWRGFEASWVINKRNQNGQTTGFAPAGNQNQQFYQWQQQRSEQLKQAIADLDAQEAGGYDPSY